MNSHSKEKGNHFLKKKNIKIRILTAIIVILTIICAICFINKLRKKTETFSPIESVNNTNYVENIDFIEIPVSSDEIVNENETNEVTNTGNTAKHRSTNSTTNDKTVSTSKYYIKVNYGANVVTIYTKDSSGNYTVPLKAMVCSTGSDTPRSGVYKMDYKYRWLSLFGNVYGQYCTRIVGNILFHSVPYLEKGNPASLEYWEYDKLGTTASAGCIRLKVEDAMWIYNNCPSGTMVEFYSSSNPGPLGKPTAPKISQYDSPYKNWDPTDPDSSNPWKNGAPNDNNESNNIESENNTIIDNNTITDNTVDNTVDNNIIENNTNENVNNSVEDNNVVSNNTISTNNTTENGVISNNTIEKED